MNTGIIYLIATIFFCVLCFISCSFTNTRMASDNYIDSLLIGEWYLVDTMDSVYPSPKFHFYGIQINPDHTRISLGIETNTGKVAIDENPSIDSIISAQNGKMVIKLCSGSVIGVFPVNYEIKENELIFFGDSDSTTYTKTSLNTQLFTPIISNASVRIDSVLMTNIKVHPYPSAFIIKNSASDIIFGAALPSSRIEIVINNFNGVGVYKIPFNRGGYLIFNSDVILGGSSDSTTTASFIVDQFDEVSNICSGRFSFDAYGGLRNQIFKYEIRDGAFTVPIYK